MKKFICILLLLIPFLGISQKTLLQLQTEATTIRNETQPGANTAVRVGQTFLDYANSFVPIIDYAVATTTSSNVYVASVNPIVTQYIHGQKFRIEFQSANTGPATLNLNGLGSVLLTSDGSTALSGGEIKTAGQQFDVYYNGTAFQLSGGGGIPLSQLDARYFQISNNLSEGIAATMRTNLGLGTSATQNTSAFLQPSNNLSDVANAATAITNLGLGSLATLNSVNNSNWSGTVLSVANGGTGTSSPGLVAGTNITITGSWPNQTINSSAGGGSNPFADNTALVKNNADNTKTFTLNASAFTTSTNVTWNLPLNAQGYFKNDGSGNTSWDGIPTYLGSILNQTSFPNTTGFSNNGSTNSIVSNAIQFSGGANTVTQTLDYTYDSDLEYINIVGVFTVQGTLSSTSYGFGLGQRGSTAFSPTGNRLKFDMTNTGTAGQLTLYDNSGTLLATSASSLSFSLNDQIEITYIKEKDIYTFYARDLTASGNSTISLTYQYTNNSGTSYTARPNMGRYCIASFGGTFSLNSLKIYSKDLMRSELMIVADSKGIYYSSQYVNRWSERLRNDVTTLVVNSGANEVTADVLTKISQIIALKPKKVLLLIGSNDVRNSVASGTYIANYDNISSQLIAAGIDVYYTLFNEAGINQNTLWTHITGTYSASKIIDNYTYQIPLADGIHTNDDGDIMVYNTILRSGLTYNVTRNLLGGPPRLSDFRTLDYDEKNSRFSVGQTLTGVANGTSAFNTAVTFASTITNPFILTGGANALQLMQYNNSNAGTSAGIGFQLITSAGNNYIYATPSNYTTANLQNAIVLQAAQQISLMATGTTDLVVKGDKVGIGVIPSTNVLEISGSTGIKLTTSATNPINHTGTTNGLMLNVFQNTNSGTSSGIGFQLSSNSSTGYIYQTVTSYVTAAIANSTVIDGRGTAIVLTNDGGATTGIKITSGGVVAHGAKTFLGGTGTTPTAFAHIAAGVAGNAQMNLTEGIAPTSPNNGDVWTESANHKVVYRQNGSSNTTSLTQTARSTAQTGANASVLSYTVGTNDGSFRVSSNVLVTASTTHAFTVTCTYTDEGNTSRTITFNFSQLAGTIGTSIANAAGTVPYEGIPLNIRCKGGTTITIATTGTFTSVTYNVEGSITQLN